MIQWESNGKMFVIEPMSVFVQTIAFICIIGTWEGGWLPMITAVLLMIYDSIRYPYPVIQELVDEEELEDDIRPD